MSKSIACLLLATLVLAAVGCGPSRQEKRVAEECRSLLPLENLMPGGEEINGAVRSDLGCPNHQYMVAVYGQWRDKDKKYYSYAAHVLDPKSPYVAAFLYDPENMVNDEDQYVVSVDRTAEGKLSQLDACRRMAEKDVDHPRAMIKEVGGLEFCVHTDSRRNQTNGVWYANAVHDDLLLTVWVWEPETYEFEYPDEVIDRVVPYIERFRFDALE